MTILQQNNFLSNDGEEKTKWLHNVKFSKELMIVAELKFKDIYIYIL